MTGPGRCSNSLGGYAQELTQPSLPSPQDRGFLNPRTPGYRHLPRQGPKHPPLKAPRRPSPRAAPRKAPLLKGAGEALPPPTSPSNFPLKAPPGLPPVKGKASPLSGYPEGALSPSRQAKALPLQASQALHRGAREAFSFKGVGRLCPCPALAGPGALRRLRRRRIGSASGARRIRRPGSDRGHCAAKLASQTATRASKRASGASPRGLRPRRPKHRR